MRIFWTNLLVLAFTSCGVPADSDAGAPSSSSNAQQGGSLASTADPSVLGLSVPSVIRQTGQVAISVGTESVFAASLLATGGQSLVTTGTLSQASDGTLSYQNGPPDKLRINWSNGVSTDIYVTRLQGDFSRDAAHFVNSDHGLEIRMMEGDTVDFLVQSTRLEGQLSTSFAGHVTLDGVRYDANVSQSGTYQSSVDVSWAEYTSLDSMQGTITSAAGLSVNVNEEKQFKFVMGDNGITNETRTVNNTWNLDGHEYSLVDAKIRYETLNGWANPSDYWIVQGSVMRDGATYGQMGVEVTDAWISIYLSIGAERVEVERFLRQQ